MTRILWKAPVVDDLDEAQKLLGAWYETGDDSGFESSEDLARVASKLRSRWPDKYQSDPPQDCARADMRPTCRAKGLTKPPSEKGTGTFCS
jgi:hypothetical protein